MLLLIEAIPDFIEILFFVMLSLAAGLSAGFFLFRIKNKRDLGIFQARETALANREKELGRIRAALKAKPPNTKTDETLAATVDMLKEEIEQTELDISIMKEDHGLEIKLLMDEISSLKS